MGEVYRVRIFHTHENFFEYLLKEDYCSSDSFKLEDISRSSVRYLVTPFSLTMYLNSFKNT